MATRFDNSTLWPSNTTTTLFRAWIQFIEDTLVTTGGWVVTSDTGQMTIASAAIPTAANQKIGYRIYRMADTLQATKPVFMRVDYGSGSATANPGLWLTIGEGSDGAGTITTIRYNGGASASANVGTGGAIATGTFTSYGSASTGRAHIALFISSNGSRIFFFSIERTKNADGTDNGTGLILQGSTIGVGVDFSRVILLANGTQPPVEVGMSYVLSGANPSAFGSDVGIGIPVPMIGVAQPPGVGITIVRASDFIAEAQFTMTLYGATRTYVQLNVLSAYHVPNLSDGTSRICMRYD
jgi:hypothetical protein